MLISRSRSTSSFTPARSISTSTSTSGSSTSCSSRVRPSSSSRARWRSAIARVSTARSATPAGSSPSSFTAEPDLAGQLLERVAAPRRDRSGRRRPSCRARAAARRRLVVGGGDRLPVVGDQRALIARVREARASRPRPRAPRRRRRRRRAGDRGPSPKSSVPWTPTPGRRCQPRAGGRRRARSSASVTSSASSSSAASSCAGSSTSSVGRIGRPAPRRSSRPRRRDRDELALERAELGDRTARTRARSSSLARSAGAASSSPSASSSRSQRVAQLELAEGLAQPRAVGLARDQLVEVDVDVDVADRGRELLGDARVLGVLGQVLLALGARDLVDVRRARPRGRRTPAAAGRPSCRRCPGRRGCCPRCRP